MRQEIGSIQQTLCAKESATASLPPDEEMERLHVDVFGKSVKQIIIINQQNKINQQQCKTKDL